jgi:predicted dehydrogenase
MLTGADIPATERKSDPMTPQPPTRVGFIGVGIMARVHITDMLRRRDTEVVAVCEPAPAAYAAAAELFDRHGVSVPPNEPDWVKWVATYASQLDAVVIITPHAFHFAQATACLEAGLDVFLEKPMVMNAEEASALIETRDRTGRLLVVGFQGSLSPQVREAARLIRSGEIGRILNISAVAWQDWATLTAGTWRQQPDLSGGGFLFDTGAHMLNTVADLAGEDFDQVAAWLENDGHAVDVRAVVMGRLASGALVTMNACGAAIPSCHSDIRVFTSKAIVRTGIWGEVLELQRAGAGRLRKVRSITPMTVWETFLGVRAGHTPNPSPPEVGLRMARLWDAIRESAARHGAVIRLPQGGTDVPTDQSAAPPTDAQTPAGVAVPS